METKFILVFLMMIGVTMAQLGDEVSDSLSQLPEEFQSKIKELQGQLNETQIMELGNKSREAFKEKCEKNGGPEAYTNAEDALKEFTTCMEGLVDRKVLEQEIEEAKPNGRVDEVFKKYCGRSPQFKGCFRKMTDAVKPCLTANEQANLNIVNNVTEQLAEFVCFKDGDRIALFIAEGGPECFQSKREELQACGESIGDNYKLNPTNLDMDSLPEIAFGDKECKQMTELQSCVVGSLEKCEQPTSANIVEALFKFIRKVTPCKDIAATPKPQSSPGAASGLTVTATTLLTAVTAHLLL